MKTKLTFLLVLTSWLSAIAQQDTDIDTANSQGGQIVEIARVDQNKVDSNTILEVGSKPMVWGTINDTSLHVFVLVKPSLGSSWWVQKRVISLSNQKWRGIVRLGNETEGIGEFFEIVALASRDSDLYEEGKDIDSLPDNALRSDIVVVSRGNPIFDIVDFTRITPDSVAEVGWRTLIRGKVPESYLHAYVAVHPSESDLWFIQKLPSPPNSDGRWQSICYFGNEREGMDEYFDVAVFYRHERNLYREGQQLDSQPANSQIFSIRRVR